MTKEQRNHPLVRLLFSRTLEEMVEFDSNHPRMLDQIGERECSEEEAKELINQLIAEFDLDTIQRIP